MTATTWNTTTIPLNWSSKGYKETIGDRVLRTAVEDGPDKVRLLGTGKTRIIEGRINLTSNQADSLVTFYNANAAKQLIIPNPRKTSSNMTVRFKQAPVFTSISPDDFSASLMFEVLR